MNKKRLIVMWLAIIITLTMIFFPPWSNKSGGQIEYALLWNPPSFRQKSPSIYYSSYYTGSLCYERLIIQLAAVWLIAGGIFLTSRKPK